MILLKAVDLTTNLNHLFRQFADLRGGGGGGGAGGLGKKVGVVFLRGVDTPMHTMIYFSNIFVTRKLIWFL